MVNDKTRIYSREDYQNDQRDREKRGIQQQFSRFSTASTASLTEGLASPPQTSLQEQTRTYIGGQINDNIGEVGNQTVAIPLNMASSGYTVLTMTDSIALAFGGIPMGRHIIFTVDVTVDHETPEGEEFPTLTLPSGVVNPPTIPELQDGLRVVLHFEAAHEGGGQRYTYIGGTIGSGGGGGGGAGKLSELEIDVNKDWDRYAITNMGAVAFGVDTAEAGSAASITGIKAMTFAMENEFSIPGSITGAITNVRRIDFAADTEDITSPSEITGLKSIEFAADDEVGIFEEQGINTVYNLVLTSPRSGEIIQRSILGNSARDVAWFNGEGLVCDRYIFKASPTRPFVNTGAPYFGNRLVGEDLHNFAYFHNPNEDGGLDLYFGTSSGGPSWEFTDTHLRSLRMGSTLIVQGLLAAQQLAFSNNTNNSPLSAGFTANLRPFDGENHQDILCRAGPHLFWMSDLLFSPLAGDIDFDGNDATDVGRIQFNGSTGAQIDYSTAGADAMRLAVPTTGQFAFFINNALRASISDLGIEARGNNGFVFARAGSNLISAGITNMGIFGTDNVFLHLADDGDTFAIYHELTETWRFEEDTLTGLDSSSLIDVRRGMFRTSVSMSTNTSITNPPSGTFYYGRRNNSESLGFVFGNSNGDVNLAEILSNPMTTYLDMDDNHIEGVEYIDFDGSSVIDSLRGVHNIDFFQSSMSIETSSSGMEIRVPTNDTIEFFNGSLETASMDFTGVEGKSFRLQSSGTSQILSSQVGIGRTSGADMYFHVPSTSDNFYFYQNGTASNDRVARVYTGGIEVIGNRGFAGSTLTLNDWIILQNYGFPVFTNGGISRVNNDVIVRSGNANRNLSNVSTFGNAEPGTGAGEATRTWAMHNTPQFDHEVFHTNARGGSGTGTPARGPLPATIRHTVPIYVGRDGLRVAKFGIHVATAPPAGSYVLSWRLHRALDNQNYPGSPVGGAVTLPASGPGFKTAAVPPGAIPHDLEGGLYFVTVSCSVALPAVGFHTPAEAVTLGRYSASPGAEPLPMTGFLPGDMPPPADAPYPAHAAPVTGPVPAVYAKFVVPPPPGQNNEGGAAGSGGQ